MAKIDSSKSATDLIVIDESMRATTESSFLLNLIVGVVGTLIVGAITFPMQHVDVLRYPYEVIWKRGPIQGFELLMAFMIIGHLWQKSRILKRQEAALLENPVEDTIDLSYDEEVTDLRQKLRSMPNFKESILLSRIDRSLAQWLGSRDVSLVSSWSSTESDREFDSSSSTYLNSQVLLTSIPMLGFIGTVLGLGQAVAGFSNFLSGNVVLEDIKVALKDVTANLGTAFDTTLLALVLSVCLTFPLTAMTRRENELLTEFDTFMDDKLISRLPPPEPASIKIENLEDSIDAAFRRYIPDPDRYDEVFSRAIDRAADAMQDKFLQLTSSYETSLTEMASRISASLAAVGDSMEASMRSMVVDVQRQDESMVSVRKSIAQEESARLKSMLADYQEQAAQLAHTYQDHIRSLETATREGAERSVSAATVLANKLMEVRETASKIDEMLHLEESISKALATVSESEEFRKTLSDLRLHLAQTDDFCRHMSKPRVITMREEIVS